MSTVKAIYAIRCKESGKFHEFNRKSCWKSSGAAKVSFNRDYALTVKFDEQSVFEIVDLLEKV